MLFIKVLQANGFYHARVLVESKEHQLLLYSKNVHSHKLL